MNFCIILEGFWHHFGTPNAFKNRVKFWKRFWKPKRGPEPLHNWRPGGMRGGPGEDNGGVLERTPDKNRGREPRRRQGTLELGLARRPRWGGGSLRAFRRAGVIIHAVSRKRVVQFSARYCSSTLTCCYGCESGQLVLRPLKKWSSPFQ